MNLWPLNVKSLFDSFTKKDEMLFFFPWLSAGLKAFSLVREALRISIIKKLLVQAIWRLKVDEKCMCVMFTMKCDFLSVSVILCFFHFAFFFFFLLFPKWETIGMKNWWPLPLCTTLSAALCEIWLTASKPLMAMDSRLPLGLVAGKGCVKKPIMLMLILPGKIAPTLLISIISGST